MFILSLLSVFIPYEVETKAQLTIRNYNDAIDYSSNYSRVIGLAINSHQNDFAVNFLSLEALYPENIKFIIVNMKSMRMNIGEKCPKGPIIFSVINRTLKSYFGYIDSVKTMAFTIEFIINPKKPVADGQESLLRQVGSMPVSLIAHQKQYDQVVNYFKLLGPYIGPINIVLITEDLGKQIGIKPSDFAIFRTEDQNLVPVPNNLDRIIAESKPNVKAFTLSYLRKSEKPCISFLKSELSEDHMIFLSELGKVIKDFEFGTIDQDDLPNIMEFVGATSSDIDNITIFNLKHQYTISLSQFFLKFGDYHFDLNKWIQPFADHLMTILKGSVPKKYQSEDLTNLEGSPTKVVGLNYKNFTISQDNDVVMLYVRPNCEKCYKFFDTYRQVAFISEKLNLTTKFGYIDIGSNGVEGGFPPRAFDPHLAIFPKGSNSSQGIPMFGVIDRQTLIGSIAMHGSDSGFLGGLNTISKDTFQQVYNMLNYSSLKMIPKDASTLRKFMKTLSEYQNKKNEEL